MTLRSLFTRHFEVKYASSLQKIENGICNEKFIQERYLIPLHFLNKLSHWMCLTSHKTVFSIEEEIRVSFKLLDIGKDSLEDYLFSG